MDYGKRQKMLIKMNKNKYNKEDVNVFLFDSWLIKK